MVLFGGGERICEKNARITGKGHFADAENHVAFFQFPIG